MPAIQLTRLRLQAAYLRDSFSRPDAFIRGYHAMLQQYADLTHRPGQSGEPPPLISAYHVPAPVLRQIMLELKPLIQNDPASALILSDTLWVQQNLECRLLAASILGHLPKSHMNEALQRVETWAKREQDEQLTEALLNLGLARHRKEAGKDHIQWLEKRLKSEKIFEQRIGLRSLQY